MRVDEHKQDVTADPTPLEWVMPGKHYKLTYGVEGRPVDDEAMLLLCAGKSTDDLDYGRMSIPPNSSIYLSKASGEDIYVWHDEDVEDFTISYKAQEPLNG